MKTKTNELGIVTQKEVHEKAHENGAQCPFCGSQNVYGISRVVGYYSPVDNWNMGKKAEFEARQLGDYRL